MKCEGKTVDSGFMDKDPEYDEKLKEVVLEKDTRISFELIKAKMENFTIRSSQMERKC